VASMNDMTQIRWNGAGIKAHTITKVRWFLTTEISSTLSIGALSPMRVSRLLGARNVHWPALAK
jgi:hypothetical protein